MSHIEAIIEPLINEVVIEVQEVGGLPADLLQQIAALEARIAVLENIVNNNPIANALLTELGIELMTENNEIIIL